MSNSLTKNILNSIRRHGQGLKDHQIMHPLRDWFLLLSIIVVFLIVSTGVSVGLYWHYEKLTPEVGTVNDSDSIIYRSSEVEAALEYLKERNELNQNLELKLLNEKRTGTPFPTESSPVISEPGEVVLDNDLSQNDNEIILDATPLPVEEVETPTFE